MPQPNTDSPRSVALTGNLKTYDGWGCDLDKYLTVGDAVDEELQHYFLEVLWPACMDSDLTQIGEAYDHKGPGGAARFETIQRHASGAWIYTGKQPRGVRVVLS